MTEKKTEKSRGHRTGPLQYHMIRGRALVLDADAARLYDVPLASVRGAVSTHRARFPRDFAVRLTRREASSLPPGCVARDEKGLPIAFSECGMAMLATVLQGKRAAEASVKIVRSCLAVREIATEHKELGQEIEELKRRQRDQRAQLEEMSSIMNRIFPAVSARRQPTLTSLN